jgi:hypothetical protein
MRSDVANKRISFTEQFVYSKDASELGQNSGLIMAYLGKVNFLSESISTWTVSSMENLEPLFEVAPISP